jgi:hypothetical protein
MENSYCLVFLLSLSNLGTVRTYRGGTYGLFKDQQVLIQTQSSVMANSLILQIDVWSQAFC